MSIRINIGPNVNIRVLAEGHGFAIFQLHILYNLKSESSQRTRRSAERKDYFDLDVTMRDTAENVNVLTLNICARYSEREPSAQTGMAIMQVDLLSGFSLAPDGILLKYPIKKVETVDDKVNIYLDSLNETKLCLDIPSVRSSNVAYTKDAFVSVIDYYEPAAFNYRIWPAAGNDGIADPRHMIGGRRCLYFVTIEVLETPMVTDRG
ncbi:unnamed protein product [Ranitomeya imitator]|uniref:Alpha-macroglobulin receptor-binding domain-containing protein n=1 Tax=Ranitomeya imitator TaxID=111125 RepID=A0ABN9MA37_9NEOB|nr:unnamed protein product [Ranitomeya imitator]